MPKPHKDYNNKKKALLAANEKFEITTMVPSKVFNTDELQEKLRFEYADPEGPNRTLWSIALEHNIKIEVLRQYLFRNRITKEDDMIRKNQSQGPKNYHEHSAEIYNKMLDDVRDDYFTLMDIQNCFTQRKVPQHLRKYFLLDCKKANVEEDSKEAYVLSLEYIPTKDEANHAKEMLKFANAPQQKTLDVNVANIEYQAQYTDKMSKYLQDFKDLTQKDDEPEDVVIDGEFTTE